MGFLLPLHHAEPGASLHTTPSSTSDWRSWLQRWDEQQLRYLPDREPGFAIMFEALDVLVPQPFLALDLACGPGSLSQRLWTRFPQAQTIAIDDNPLLLRLGQEALGPIAGYRWVAWGRYAEHDHATRFPLLIGYVRGNVVFPPPSTSPIAHARPIFTVARASLQGERSSLGSVRSYDLVLSYLTSEVWLGRPSVILCHQCW